MKNKHLTNNLSLRTEMASQIIISSHSSLYPFSAGEPPIEAQPLEWIAEILSSKEVISNLGYAPPQGNHSLRELIAARYSQRWGRAIGAEEVLITNGSQQALSLLSSLFIGKQLVDCNRVLVQPHCFFLALDILEKKSPFPLVPVDLLDNETWPKGGILYVNALYTNPTGEVLTKEQLNQIYNTARKRNIIIIQDEPYEDLGSIANTLQDVCVPSHVCYVLSFSKSIAPGLRLGAIISDRETIQRLTNLKLVEDVSTNVLSQVIVQKILENTQRFEAHLAKVNSIYKQRRTAMLNALSTYMPSSVSWTNPTGGMFIWLTLPTHLNVRDITELAVVKGVAVVPGHIFTAESKASPHIRLSFVKLDSEQISRGIKILADVIKAK